jgi:hypothetical protein
MAELQQVPQVPQEQGCCAASMEWLQREPRLNPQDQSYYVSSMGELQECPQEQSCCAASMEWLQREQPCPHQLS